MNRTRNGNLDLSSKRGPIVRNKDSKFVGLEAYNIKNHRNFPKQQKNHFDKPNKDRERTLKILR